MVNKSTMEELKKMSFADLDSMHKCLYAIYGIGGNDPEKIHNALKLIEAEMSKRIIAIL